MTFEIICWSLSGAWLFCAILSFILEAVAHQGDKEHFLEGFVKCLFFAPFMLPEAIKDFILFRKEQKAEASK